MPPLLTSLLITLLLLLPVFPSMRIAAWLFPGDSISRRAFPAACLYPILVNAVLLLLHPFALINLWAVTAVMVLLNVLSLLIRVQATTSSIPPQNEGTGRVALFLAAALFFGTCLFHFLKLYFHGAKLYSDDLSYHFTTVAGWMRSDSLSHPLIALGAYYPFNPHMLSFYLTLPTGDIRWVWVGGLFWILLAIVSILRLGTLAAGANRTLLTLAAAVFAFSGPVVWMALLFCSSDLAGASVLIAAATFLIPTPTDTSRQRRVSLVMTGLMCGYAIGTKPTYLIPAAVLLLGALVMPMLRDGVSFRKEWRAAWRPALLMGGAVFLTGSFWYLRNLIVAGNPLFPVKFLVFGGPVRPRHIEPTVLATHLFQWPLDPAVWIHSLLALLDWPLVAGVLACIGLLLSAVYIAQRLWSQGRQKDFSILLNPLTWIVASAAAMFVMHIFSPFSGSTLDGTRLQVYSRYIVYVHLVGLVGLAWMTSLAPPLARGVGVSAMVLALIWLIVGYFPEYPVLVAVSAAAGLLGALVYSLLARLPYTASRYYKATVLALLPLLAFGAVAARETHIPPRQLHFFIAPGHEGMVDTMAAIDRLPEGSRLAQFTNMVWEFGYLYGSRAQHELVFIDQNGLPMSELHVAHDERRVGGPDGHPRFGLQVNFHYNQPDKVSLNTLASGVEYLLVTKFSFLEPHWPPQRDDIRSAGVYTLIWGNGHSEIYASPGVPNPFSEDWQ